MFSPRLSDGERQLKFRIARINGFGEVDSVEQTVTVRVSRDARIVQAGNFPNPFPHDTFFTFTLSGERVPDELAIRAFTVAGRKIREIAVPASSLNVGFNRIYWDGRDSEGDEIANGYYFYQITMKGGGKTESAIQKLTKVR